MNINELNKMAEYPLFSKNFNDRYVLTLLVLLPPMLLSEELIASSKQCQSLIAFMSSWIPGITVMSKSSIIPQTVALEISLAWIIVFLVIAINLYRAWWRKSLFIQSSQISKQRFSFFYLGRIAFLLLEITKSPVSFYHGTIATFHSESSRHLLNSLMQFKLGVGFIAWMEVMWLPIVLIGWILMSVEIIKNLIKRIQESER